MASKYYVDSFWDNKKGRPYCLVYKRGEPKHFAIFYDEEKANECVKFLNGAVAHGRKSATLAMSR